MAKQQSTQKLVNELEKAVEESKRLLKIQRDLSVVIEQTAQELKDGFSVIDKSKTKDLATFNKLLQNTNKLLQQEEKNNQEKAKTEKELIKNQQELSKLRKLEIQEQQAELRLQKQLKKEREIELKQREKQDSAYAQQSKRLNDLRKSYKDLAAAEKANTKEAKAMLKEITKLDKKLKDIDESVGQNFRSVGNYTKALDKMNKTLGKVGLVAALTKGFELLSSAFGDSRNGAEAMALAMNKLSAYAQVFGKRFGMIAKNLGEIFSSDANILTKMSLATSAIADGFKGVGKEAENLEKGLEKQIKGAVKYTIQIEQLERALSILSRTQRTNLQLAENDTLSFEARRKFSARAVRDAEEYGKKLREQSRIQLQTTAEEIAAHLQITDASKMTTEQLAIEINKRLKNEETARKISDDLESKYTQSYVNYQTQKLEADDMYIDSLEKQNKLYSDLNELELDLELDLLDNIKTINERKLANDKYTIEERKKLLGEMTTEFDEIFKDQLETVITQRKQVIETERERLRIARENGDISKEEYQQELANFKLQEEKLTIENLSNIAQEENVDTQKKLIQELKLGEKFTLRYLEIIKDYRTGVLDLNDALDELNKLQSEDDAKKLETQLEKRKELFDAFNTYVENAFAKSNEKRNLEIETEANAIQSRIQEIQTAAELGNEEAKKSLASEERKAAELERKKEQQRKKEQRQEAIIAGLKLLGENADQPNALGKTISDYTALVSIISSLPAFIDGTEKVADGVKGGVKFSNGKDGYLARFDGEERILNPSQNKMLGNLTNDEVAELGRMHRMGELEYSPVVMGSNKALEEKVERMTESIENLHKKIPIQRFDYDSKAKEHIHTIQYNNKVEKLRTKAKNTWR